MSSVRRLAYSISGASVVTALSWLFHDAGGAILAWPGILLNLWLNSLVWALYIVFSDLDFAFYIDAWVIFTLIFYSWVFYNLLDLLIEE